MKKSVLITGASQGIGACTAYLFAKSGYDVIINYLTHEKEAYDLQKMINREFDVKTLVIQADISKEIEVKNMVDKVISELDHIDVLINNASIAIDEQLDEKSLDSFKKVIDTNLIGTFLVSKYVGKKMKEKNSGCIINISSNNAIDSYNTYSVDYDASKAGVISLTHNLANFFAPIRVNAIAPGWVKTDAVMSMNPQILETEKKKILLKRFASEEEIAKVALFLASEDASYINDSIIKVDGGKNVNY